MLVWGGNLLGELMDAVRQAGAISNHLRRDLGYAPGLDFETAVKVGVPVHPVNAVVCPLANHDFSDSDRWRHQRAAAAFAKGDVNAA